MDRAGQLYWDEVWGNNKIKKNQYTPELFNYNSSAINDYYYVQFHKLFKKLLGHYKNKKIKVLEIGCANSLWLVYFNKYWRFNVSGIDYSQVGCDNVVRILKHNNVEGEIFCSDLYSPPVDLIEKFDLVISFGLVEHFDNTSKTISALTKYVKPGGYLFTEIPNLRGIPGYMTKKYSKNVYNVHRPLNLKELRCAHKQDNLFIKSNGYVSFFNYSVINIDDLKQTKLYSIYYNLGRFFTGISMLIDKHKLPILPNNITSPYLYCYCKKKKL